MRRVVILAFTLLALTASGCRKRPTNEVAPRVEALAADGLPANAPSRAIVLGQCQICHTSEYVAQQRLTPAQWAATVKKMIGWGAPISEAEGEALAKVLAEAYPSDKPDRVRPLVPNPGGRP